MKHGVILIGCEESQAVTIEFRKLGFQAYSCDLLPCSGGHPEWHLQMDVFKAIEGGFLELQDGSLMYVRQWRMGVFFPDCTYLTVTANKWYKDQPDRKSGALVGQQRRDAREKAVEFFKNLYNSDIEHIAMENPIGVMSSVFKKPDQIVTPMQFGHIEPKKTCLWLKNLPLLVPSHHDIEPEYHTTASGKRMPRWYAYADKSKGQKERAKIRSKTFAGIANAMAAQWGDYLSKPKRTVEQLSLTL
jgi:hypothetical protein